MLVETTDLQKAATLEAMKAERMVGKKGKKKVGMMVV